MALSFEKTNLKLAVSLLKLATTSIQQGCEISIGEVKSIFSTD
jgi:hypothetical protein